MPMNSFTIEDNGAFYVDDDILRATVASVHKFTNSDYRIEITFYDSFSHVNDNIDQLIAQPYFRVAEVKSLRIRSETSFREPDHKAINIIFYESSEEGRVQASITSTNDDLHIVKEEISRELKACRAKY